MKKLSIFLLIILVAVVFVAPAISLADDDDDSSRGLVTCGFGSDDCTFDDLLEMVNNIINFIVFYLVAPLAALAIAASGIMMVVYSGNEGKVTQAKEILYYAVLGLIISLSAVLVVSAVVRTLVGETEPGQAIRDRLEEVEIDDE